MQDAQKGLTSHPPNPGAPRRAVPRASENRGLFEHPADSSEESPYVQSGSLSHKNPVFPQTVNVAGVLTS